VYIKRVFPLITISITLIILLAGCGGQKEDGVWYNGEWMTRDEYAALKWQEELDAAGEPAPSGTIVIPPVNIDFD